MLHSTNGNVFVQLDNMSYAVPNDGYHYHLCVITGTLFKGRAIKNGEKVTLTRGMQPDKFVREHSFAVRFGLV